MPAPARVRILSLILFAAFCAAAQADDFAWTGGAGNGVWNDPGNWTNTTVGGTATFPDGDDNVSFTTDATSTSGAAASVDVASAVTFSLSPGTLTVGDLSNDGVFAFLGSGSSADEVLIFAAGDRTIAGSGQIVMAETTDSVFQINGQTVTNAAGHTIRGTGEFNFFNATPTFINQGTIAVETGGMLFDGGSTTTERFLSSGTISVADGETLQFLNFNSIESLGTTQIGTGSTILMTASGFTNATFNATNVVTLDTGTTSISGTLTNNGVIQYRGSGSSADEVLIFAAGDRTIAGSGQIVMAETTDSVFQINGQTVTNAAGHTIRGTGEFNFFNATPTFINQGTIAVETGGMLFDGGSTTTERFLSSGTISVADGETLQFLNFNSIESLGTTQIGTGSTILMTASGFTNATFNATNVVTLDQGVTTVAGTLTNDGTIEFEGSTDVITDEELRFVGNVTLGGTGELVMKEVNDSNIDIVSQTLTNGAGHTIRGTGSIDFFGADPAFVNQGPIAVEIGGMLFDGGNTGSESFTNSGTITIADGETLQFLNFDEVTLGATGELQPADSGTLLLTNSTLVDSTINAAGRITLDQGVTTVAGTLTNDGTIEFEGSTDVITDEELRFVGNVTLGGTGELVMKEVNDSNIDIVSQTLTNGAGHTIRGTGSIDFFGADPAFVNEGAVLADIAGELLMFDGGSPANFNAANQTLIGGTFGASGGGLLRFDNADIDTNQSEIVLDGVGSTIIDQSSNDALADLATNDTGAALRILGGRGFSTAATGFTNRGEVEMGGGTFNAATFDNQAAGVITGFGTITPRPTNGGTVRAVGGTLAFSGGVGGAGVIEATAGATVDLSAGANSSAGQLTLRTGGGLTVGSRTVSVSGDYLNENAGTGNAFNPRAGVSGGGAINSSVAKTQTLTGDVAGGSTATPAIDLGAVRIGVGGQQTATADFRVNNSAGGPSLRGAVKTSGDGATLATDDQFALAGGPQNFGPIAAGSQSGDFTVSFTGDTAGAASRTLAVVNNFDNVGDQVVTVTAEAFNPAAPSITPDPINLGDLHIGQSAQQTITIANDAPAGAFSESLIAGVTTSGAGVSRTGPANVTVAPGASNAAVGVSVSTAAAGVRTGSVSVAQTSTGATGLADLNLGTEVIPVSANVYRFADPSIQNAQPIDFGIVHVGEVVAAEAVVVRNTATADGFSEGLDAAFTESSSRVTTSGPGINNLAAGAVSDTGLLVGINTTTSGVINGTAQIAFTSDGAGVNTLGQTALGGQSVAVTATVNNFANAVLSKASGDGVLTEPTVDAYVLDLGGVRNGQGDLSAELELTNLIAGPADDLAGGWTLGSSDFGLSGFVSFADLAAGDSIDGLTVTIDDASSGVFSHTITLSPRSTNASGFIGALSPVTVELIGTVFLPGDYNADGSVTEADYNVWTASFASTTNLNADGNNDGRVDAADYTVWRDNLGNSLPALASSAAVPEPASWMLCFSAWVAFGIKRRSK